MDWVKVKRLRPYSDEPEVIIKRDRITFNVVLYRHAELNRYKYVCIYSDDENRRLAFKFLKNKDDNDAFKLSRSGARGCWCYSRDLLSKDWVLKVAQDADINRFACSKNDGLWTVTLIPSFEMSVLRTDSGNLSSNITGIYRYLNSYGEIVYIGKGCIKSRLAEKNVKNGILTLSNILKY